MGMRNYQEDDENPIREGEFRTFNHRKIRHRLHARLSKHTKGLGWLAEVDGSKRKRQACCFGNEEMEQAVHKINEVRGQRLEARAKDS